MTQLVDFHDVRFPLRVGFGATGGPERRTEIVTLQSGLERRNARQAHARRTFDATGGVQSIADLEAIAGFYEARRGELFAFRYRDPFDWKSCALADAPAFGDQALGTGDGTRTVFQLAKSYGSGATAYARPVKLPVAGTVKVGVNGAQVSSGFTVDHLTGTVTFAAPPTAGAAVTAGFEFDIKARFATPSLALSMTAFNAGTIPSIPIVEVL